MSPKIQTPEQIQARRAKHLAWADRVEREFAELQWRSRVINVHCLMEDWFPWIEEYADQDPYYEESKYAVRFPNPFGWNPFVTDYDDEYDDRECDGGNNENRDYYDDGHDGRDYDDHDYGDDGYDGDCEDWDEEEDDLEPTPQFVEEPPILHKTSPAVQVTKPAPEPPTTNSLPAPTPPRAQTKPKGEIQMQDLSNLPASIAKKIIQAQTIAQQQPTEARSLMAEVGVELARTAPELLTVLMGLSAGFKGLELYEERSGFNEEVAYRKSFLKTTPVTVKKDYKYTTTKRIRFI